MRAAAAALALAALLVSAGAWAQPPAQDVERARALFERGVAAVERGEWAAALGAFEESYRLSGRPAALYNAATTLRALGRHVASRDALDRLLRDHRQIDPEMRRVATTMRAEEAGRVATLVIEDIPPEDDASVRVDGESVTADERGTARIDLDEGDHVVEAIGYEDGATYRWEGELAGGERETIEISLAGGEGGGFWSGPAPWIALIAIVVAGAIVGGVLYWESLQPEPGAAYCIGCE